MTLIRQTINTCSLTRIRFLSTSRARPSGATALNLQQQGKYTTIRAWNANGVECTIYVDDVAWGRIPEGPEDYGEKSVPLAALSQEVLDILPLAYTGWVEIESTFVLAGNAEIFGIDVPGAAVGDSVVVNPKINLGDPWSWDCWVEEADLVFFRVRNNSPDNDTLPAAKWRATVWHYAPLFVVEGGDSRCTGIRYPHREFLGATGEREREGEKLWQM